MRKITKYLSNDGLEFDSESLCLAHERLAYEVAERLKTLLPPVKDGAEAYTQQSGEVVLALQLWLVEQVEKASGQFWPEVREAREPLGMSIIGRFQCDCGPAAIRGAWFRLQCMDRKFREWGQPFYAIEANKRAR
jgi:hypothetical protein